MPDGRAIRILMDSALDVSDRWVPLRLLHAAAGTRVEWIEGGPVADANFENAAQVLRAEAASGLRRLRLTEVHVLEEAGAAVGPDPSAFIFHVSRCGSTLLTDVLASFDGSAVIGESVILDDILETGKAAGLTSETIAARLRGFLCAHARLARPGRCFVKFDCDHIFHFELISRTFPAVPWIFLYRDPIEVMVSHARRRGLPMIPAADEMAGWEDGGQPVTELLDDYAARKIGRICAIAASVHRPRVSLPVNYRDLAARLRPDILPFLRITPNAAEDDRIEAALRRDAKHPEKIFVPDAALKRLAATAHLQAATERWARPAYDRLEALIRPA